MAQRNYLINTTTIATAASGTTITSGNTQSATFEVGRTMVRSSVPAGSFSATSQTWSLHYLVSQVSTGEYAMRLKLQRRNSSGVMQTESGYTSTRTATGTYDDNLTWTSGTWAANDQLAVVWEHERTSGSGNKTGTIDANGASYVDAPVDTTPLTQDITGESINNLADAHLKVLGQPLSFADSINNLADTHTEVVGLRIALSDDTNLFTDYFVYGKRPRWQASVLKTVDAANVLSLTLSDSANNLADNYLQLSDGRLSLGDTLPALTETLWFSSKPRWQDSLSQQVASPFLTLTFAESINNLTDDYSQIEGQLKSFSDSANSLSDAHSLSEGQLVLCSDSVNAWADSLGQIEDELLSFSESITIADSYSQIEGQQKAFSEDANNFSDSVSKIEGQLVSFFDSVNSLSDTTTVGVEHRIITAESAANLADALTMIEGARVSLSESVNNLADDVSFEVVSNDQPISASDDLNSWADSSSRILEHRLALAESINNLADSLARVEEAQLSLTDAFPSLADSLSSLVSCVVGLSDSFAQSESYTQILEHRLTISDNASNLADSFNKVGDGLLSAADAMVQFDACSLYEEHLVPCSDAISLVDSVSAFEAGFLPLNDSLSFDDDVQVTLGATGGQILSDSFTLIEAFQITLELPMTMSDDLNNWADGTAMYLPCAVTSVRVPADSRRVIV